MRTERILPGTEEVWRYPEDRRNLHEVYRAKGIPHYGRHKGLFKIGIRDKGAALDAGYTFVREGAYYAFMSPPEAKE